MRLRRIAGTKEQLALLPEVIGSEAQMAGRWAQLFGNTHPLHLEIGCGRGKFIVTLARENPEINFIAMELQAEVIFDAVLRVKKDFPPNLRFLWQNAEQLPQAFAAGEVQTIYLNFSDPWPKTRHAKRRLTHDNFLALYRRILSPAGRIIGKTDGRALFTYSLDRLLAGGFRLAELDWDYAGGNGDAQTEYETRFRKQNKPIYRYIAVREENLKEAFEMKYISTRGHGEAVNAATAIRKGIAADGGLFVPVSIPVFPYSWQELAAMEYGTLAEKILGLYLTDYSAERIAQIVAASYNKTNFAAPQIAPLVALDAQQNILELWHGPTAAFKDMALQIMPRLLSEAVVIEGGTQEVEILVATSGDTGKAALEGFKNVDGINVICFYPYQGVSKVQELQMSTTDGKNTHVVAVRGNFDDCQSAVKNIFADGDFAARLAQSNKEFSSANSINWGRLLPQIVYYFWSYAQLLQQQKLQAGEPFNVVVPTGNFGNILAAYYAREMGLPIGQMICASNSNKVLTDVLSSGVYDKRRDFLKTTSPSMDILVSSNFERFYFAMSDGNAELVAQAFRDLSSSGSFTAPAEVVERWQSFMCGGFADEAAVMATIKEIYEQYGYTLDPHTAVAVKVYRDYLAKTGDARQVVIASTASPYKFPQAVLQAICGFEEQFPTEQARLEKLAEVSKTPIHRGLQGLEQKAVLHDTVVTVAEMPQIVGKILHV